MYIVKNSLLLIVLFILSWPAHSADCEKPSNEEVGHWSELKRLSQRLGYIVCVEAKGGEEGQDLAEQPADAVFEMWKSQVRQSTIELDEVIFGEENQKKFQELAMVFTEDVERALSPMLGVVDSNVSKTITSSISLPSVNAKEDNNPQNIGLLKVNVWTKGKSVEKRFEVKDLHEGEVAERCKQKFTEARGNHCIAYVKAWSKAVSEYNSQLSKISPAQMSLAAVKYSKDWENFYSLSRSQTLFDTIYTSRRYRKKLSGAAFVKAPDVQYFLFRPGVVLDYVEDADEGSRYKEALSFEWWGFNYWRQCPYWIEKACGMSVVSIFSDRADSDNYSLGLMFHYDNNLSFGIARGMEDEEEASLFVTVDFLKAMESKEERLRDWKKTIKENLTEFGSE